MVLAVVEVCAQADLKVSTTPDTSTRVPSARSADLRSAADARYEALLEQELRVSTSSAVDGRRLPRGHQSLLELRPPLPHERFRGQRALAGRESLSRRVPAVQPGPRQISSSPAVSVAARSVSAQPASGQSRGAHRTARDDAARLRRPPVAAAPAGSRERRSAQCIATYARMSCA